MRDRPGRSVCRDISINMHAESVHMHFDTCTLTHAFACCRSMFNTSHKGMATKHTKLGCILTEASASCGSPTHPSDGQSIYPCVRAVCVYVCAAAECGGSSAMGVPGRFADSNLVPLPVAMAHGCLSSGHRAWLLPHHQAHGPARQGARRPLGS